MPHPLGYGGVCVASHGQGRGSQLSRSRAPEGGASILRGEDGGSYFQFLAHANWRALSLAGNGIDDIGAVGQAGPQVRTWER